MERERISTKDFSVSPQKDPGNPYSGPSTSIGEFVERRFIPEHVAIKTPAGRSYFRTILNHVLPPEQVARAFAVAPVNPGKRFKDDSGLAISGVCSAV